MLKQKAAQQAASSSGQGQQAQTPQASKLTKPRVTWKVSSQEPSDVTGEKNWKQNWVIHPFLTVLDRGGGFKIHKNLALCC